MSIATASDKRAKFATNLRDLANYLEAHPEIPAPLGGAVLGAHVDDADEFIAAARVLNGDIDVNGKYVVCRRAFGVMALGVQIYWRDLLAEQPEPDVEERVRALIDGTVAA